MSNGIAIPCPQCSGTGQNIEMACGYCGGLMTYFLDGNILIGSEWRHSNDDREATILDFDASKNEYLIQYNKNGTARISERDLVNYWIRVSAPDPDEGEE